MKKTTCIIAFLLPGILLYAQIGLVGAFKTHDAPEWRDLIGTLTEQQISTLKGWNAGVDYWFRLKDRRVEFTPELSYEMFTLSLAAGELNHRLLNFHFNSNFYFLDFDNDCNCPTFSKKGNFFSKGFFVQVSPGLSWMVNKLEFTGIDLSRTIKDDGISVAIGGGVGLDLGISDLLTITPLVKYYFYPNARWKGLDANSSEGDSTASSSITQFYAGIRLGFRLKPEKPYWQ